MCNMHKPFEQIIEKAGYKTWPNLIKNLRLSCENDWLTAAEAPAHVIAAWIGHDIAVQNSNYAIVSDGHFDQFNQRVLQPEKSGNHSGNKQPRIAANPQKVATMVATVRPHKTLETNEKAGSNDPTRMLWRGLEPVRSSIANSSG